MRYSVGNLNIVALKDERTGISLPNWLAVARVFGVEKAVVYVPIIIGPGTLVGWVAGFILS